MRQIVFEPELRVGIEKAACLARHIVLIKLFDDDHFGHWICSASLLPGTIPLIQRPGVGFARIAQSKTRAPPPDGEGRQLGTLHAIPGMNGRVGRVRAAIASGLSDSRQGQI
jgi:hypothetical protein